MADGKKAKKSRERARAQAKKKAQREAFAAKQKTGGAAMTKRDVKKGYDPDYAVSADVRAKEQQDKRREKFGKKFDSEKLAAGNPEAYRPRKEKENSKKTKVYHIQKTPIEKRKVREIEEKTAPETMAEEKLKIGIPEIPPTEIKKGRGHGTAEGLPDKPGGTLAWRDTKGNITKDKPKEKVYGEQSDPVSEGETRDVVKPGTTKTRIVRDPATAKEQVAREARAKKEGLSDYAPDKLVTRKEKERKRLGLSKEKTKTKYFGAIPESEIEKAKEEKLKKAEYGKTGEFKVRGQKIIEKYKPSKMSVKKAKERFAAKKMNKKSAGSQASAAKDKKGKRSKARKRSTYYKP